MNALNDNRPVLALVDDDSHSARLLLRHLGDAGALRFRWLGDARRALRTLMTPAAGNGATWPEILIVDLKTRSSATRDFIAHVRMAAHEAGTMIVAFAPSLDRTTRESLLEAGAAAVFERHPDPAAYRREAESLISFWARHQRLDRVGT
jgi:DNA-binding response OmpR family regulator